MKITRLKHGVTDMMYLKTQREQEEERGQEQEHQEQDKRAGTRKTTPCEDQE